RIKRVDIGGAVPRPGAAEARVLVRGLPVDGPPELGRSRESLVWVAAHVRRGFRRVVECERRGPVASDRWHAERSAKPTRPCFPDRLLPRAVAAPAIPGTAE